MALSRLAFGPNGPVYDNQLSSGERLAVGVYVNETASGPIADGVVETSAAADSPSAAAVFSGTITETSSATDTVAALVATLYWRGGTGTWTNASTDNWAATATASKFTASRTLTTLTVTAGTQPVVGDTVWHTNGTFIGTITVDLGGGLYTMDTSGSVASRAMVSATIGAGPATSTDDVIFDANSNVGTASFIVTVNTSAVCKDFTASSLAGTMTLAVTALGVFGNWSTPGSNFATSGTGNLTFSATSAKTVQYNAITITHALIFNGVGGSWQFLSALTLSGSGAAGLVTLTNGTLDLNTFTLSCGRFNTSNANTRVLAFGSGGRLTITDDAATILDMATMTGFTYTGTPDVRLTYAGATGTRNVRTGSTAGASASNVLPVAITAGSDLFTFTTGTSVGLVDFTGFTGAFSGTGATFYGGLTLGAGMTVTGTAEMVFAGTATQVITSNAVAFSGLDLTINAVSGTVRLVGDLFIGSGTSDRLTLTNGTLDINGYVLSAGDFLTATGTKNITWDGGTLLLAASSSVAFNNAAPTNFTTTAGSGAGIISMTGATAKTFVGGGSTFNAALNQSGAGTLTLTGSNTFTDITNTVNSTSVLFTAATTTTFTVGFNLNSTTIGSVTAANHNLSLASGTVSVSNDTISRSQAAGGATWNAFTSNGNTDGGNNSGWNFAAPPINDTVTETVSAADAQAALAVFASSLTDAANALDSVTVVGTVSDSVSEVAAAADTVGVTGVQGVVIAESVTALDTVTLGTLILAAIAEAASASDTVTLIIPVVDEIVEEALAADEYSVVQYRQTWFLSFERVVPPPTGQGPGNPGELFGDTRLQIYPPVDRRTRRR